MADDRIGVARLNVPEHLPPSALADGRKLKAKLSTAVNLREHLRQTTGNCDCGEQNLARAEPRAVIPATGEEARVQA
jgi:hypothetical protein